MESVSSTCYILDEQVVKYSQAEGETVKWVKWRLVNRNDQIQIYPSTSFFLKMHQILTKGDESHVHFFFIFQKQ